MGGNALKEFNPKRVTSLEVMNIWWRINGIMNFHHVEAHLVPWCLDKETHGDIDILVESDVSLCLDAILETLKVDKLHRKTNGSVISIGVPLDDGIVQVDLIRTPPEEMCFSRMYYSGGGLGMIVGRVASWNGFVLGFDGLRVRADPSKPWSRDLFISTSPFETLEFLGYEPYDSCGFKTELDVWRFGLSSPLAKPYMFHPDLAGADNRSRDRARPSYQRFQGWLRDNFPNELVKPDDIKHPSFSDACDMAEKLDPRIYIRVAEQERAWNENKTNNKAIGLEAVLFNFPSASETVINSIIREMQRLLPPKAEREALFRLPDSRECLIEVARTAARHIGVSYGLTPTDNK